MYFQKYQARKGIVYSFIYYDTTLRKNVRIPSKKVSHIKTDEEAHEFIKKWDSTYDAMKHRIELRQEWSNKFHEFKSLIDTFVSIRREEAPNSFESDRCNLENYILPFFLEKRNLNNLNTWPDYFEEFRDHLLTVKPLKHHELRSQPIAYATKNNIIKCLNIFLEALYRRRKIDRFEKCRYFPKHKIKHRDETSIILEDAQKTIFDAVQKHYPLSAEFFWVLVKSGLRLNEGLGLSLSDFFQGKLEELKPLLPDHLEPLGYIALETQPALRSIRDLRGHVPRKPLKGKKGISFESARTIPIFDPKAFEILAKRFNEQLSLFNRRAHGGNPNDYLLFDGLTKNRFSQEFRIGQKDIRMTKPYTAHDCRHTYASWLAEASKGSFALCRLVLGHASMDMTLRYIHLNAKIQKSLKTQNQLKSPMNILHKISEDLTTKASSQIIGISTLLPLIEQIAGIGSSTNQPTPEESNQTLQTAKVLKIFLH